MNANHAFAGVAGAVLCFSLCLSPLRAAGPAEFNAEELHTLYRSGRYFDCYRASAMAVRENPRAAMPYFYAALALTHTDADRTMREQVRNPYGKALHFLEEAKANDPQGRQLTGVRKGLAIAQKVLVEKAVEAYHAHNPNIRPFFDRLAAVFNHREGVWKNHYHHGRFLVDEEYDFSQWDNPFYRLADTGRDLPGLDPEVRQIIYLHNLCRMNPPLFRDTYLMRFLGENARHSSDHYISTLFRDLSEAEPALPLYPDPQLIKAADFHANDLAAHRIFGHSSSDGTSFSARVRRIAKNRSYCGENCAAGYNKVLDCFMGLLIDRGVESLGHRHNIMSSGYKYIGVGVIDPDDQWKIWVFDFAGN